METFADRDQDWLKAELPDADESETEMFIEWVGKVWNDKQDCPDSVQLARDTALLWLKNYRKTATSRPLTTEQQQ